MNIEQILRNPQKRSSEENEVINEYFIAKRKKCVENQDERDANAWAILHSIFASQNDYINIFDLFDKQEFYVAWCQLERIEINVKGILGHHPFIDDEYKILFIKEYVRKLQSLFPYKVFGSSEYVKKEVRCSICNALITLRKRCKHKKGELYMGEMCTHLIVKADLLGMSAVDAPFNKYSVWGVTKKEDDSYRYPQIEFLMGIIDHPFNEWRTENRKVFESHDKFKVGRNDKCPCRSDKKYKNCCLPKSGIEIDHTEFLLKVPTIKSQGRSTRLNKPVLDRKN